MPALTSPWFQQRTPLADQAEAVVVQERPASTMTEAEMDELTKRVGRPTTSSRAKISQSWKLDMSFVEKGRNSWSKMELFEDVKKCMWKENGVIKESCKVRPLQKDLNQTTHSR